MTFNGNGNRRAGDAAGHSAGSRGNNNGAEITRRPPKVQVVSAVHGPGSRLAFEPHRESDPGLADLQDIQLGFELMVEDAKLLHVRLVALIDDAKSLSAALANLSCDYQEMTHR